MANLINFSIRPARTNDQKSIQRVYDSAIGPSAGQDTPWERLIEKGGLLAAETGGQIIAFGGIDVQAAEQLKWLYVLPKYQGAGIGAKILKQLEDIGWRANLLALRLHSAPAAVEFYRRQGYREVPLTEQFGHDHEGVEMIKEREVVGGN